MNKERLKQKIIDSIDNEKCINYLRSLVRLPSESGQPTLAQELILQKMGELDFQIDRFSGDTKGLENYPDYSPLPMNEKIDERAYNIVSLRKSKGQGKSLMLFAHVDTEICKAENTIEAYEGKIDNGKIYGHGIADDKCGLATIVLAVEAVLKETDLDGDLIIMSILGKRGGSAGTLKAIDRGYKADGAIYVHPAETGRGYREIKSFSMGTVDFVVRIKGKKGPEADELDSSEVNAVKKGAYVIRTMSNWDEARRKKLLFKEGTYKNTPSTKLDISNAFAEADMGRDPVNFEVKSRLYFGGDETIDSVLEDLREYFVKEFSDDPWLSSNIPEIEALGLRAVPAKVGQDSDIVRLVEKNIADISGIEDFVYQYHGASDIRFPILYGNTPTLGIGPLCGGLYGTDWTEWVDEKEYIDGIKMLASTIIDWCIE